MEKHSLNDRAEDANPSGAEEQIAVVDGFNTFLKNTLLSPEDRATCEAMYRLTLSDSLTGLSNLLSLEIALSDIRKEIVLNKENGIEKTPFLIAFDLDKFKELNDTSGHSSGDEYLKSIAKHVREILRSSDTFARVGGDEFVIILPDSNILNATKIAGRIMDATTKIMEERSHDENEKNGVDVSVSVGVAPWDEEQESKEVRMQADYALYVAKALGKDAVVSYGDALKLDGINDLKKPINPDSMYNAFIKERKK